MLPIGFSKKLCPYCFEYFYVKDAPFLCYTDTAECAYAKKSAPDHTSFFKTTKCPDCGKKLTHRLCPHCKKDIQAVLITAKKNLTFTIIGAKNVGKTHYLTVLIDLFRSSTLVQELGIGLELIGDSSVRKFHIYRDSIKNNHTIGLTKIATEVASDPLIVALSFLKNGRIRNITLYFFDTTSEYLNSEGTLLNTNKCIAHADGIVLLMDPLQLPSVREKLNAPAWLPEQNVEILDILNRVTNLMATASGENYSKKKIPVPIAVAFNKFDVLNSLVDSLCNPLLREPDHSQGFDLKAFEEMNANMRDLLKQWGGEGIINAADHRYAKQGFFALSALGCNPHENNGEITDFTPKRVLDPFLWLLYQHGYIKAYASR